MNIGGAAAERLERALQSFPLVTHGINLSVGSTDDLNHDYLDSIKKLLDKINAPWWSDHLCFTSVEGVYMHDLLPLPFTKEAVNHVAQRVKYVQEYIGRPFLLENISFYMHLPGCEMTDAQFLAEVLEKADCGLLLDVNNVYVNSVNHGFDALEYLKQLPIERTVQMHIAGHSKRGNLQSDALIDTHGAKVIPPVYDLLRHILKQIEVKAVMLERDQNYPEFQELIDELNMTRKIASETQPSLLKNDKRKAVKEQSKEPMPAQTPINA